MSSAEITLYGTRACPYCIAARRLLAEKGLQFQDVAVDDDMALRAEIRRRSGFNTVPQIWFGDRHIGGFTELHALGQRGELSEQLSELVENAVIDPT